MVPSTSQKTEEKEMTSGIKHPVPHKTISQLSVTFEQDNVQLHESIPLFSVSLYGQQIEGSTTYDHIANRATLALSAPMPLHAPLLLKLNQSAIIEKDKSHSSSSSSEDTKKRKSTDSIAACLKELDMESYLPQFQRDEIELTDLQDLSKSQLEKLVPKLGPRARLLAYIKKHADPSKKRCKVSDCCIKKSAACIHVYVSFFAEGYENG